MRWVAGIGILCFFLAFAFWFIWHFIKVMSLMVPGYRARKAQYDRQVKKIDVSMQESQKRSNSVKYEGSSLDVPDWVENEDDFTQ